MRNVAADTIVRAGAATSTPIYTLAMVLDPRSYAIGSDLFDLTAICFLFRKDRRSSVKKSDRPQALKNLML
jgi:hypothetical protein